MSGQVFKRCGCRDEQGRQVGAVCPDLKRTGHGSWAFRVDLGPGPDDKGVLRKRRQRYVGGFETRKLAEAERDKLMTAARNGMHVDRSRLTVAQYLEEWLASKTAGDLRASSARVYRGHIDAYLTPQLGHVRLSDLRVAHVEAAYAAIRAGNVARLETKGGRAVGPTTLRRIHGTLMSALNSAVKRRVLPYNPATHAELPAASRPKVAPWEPAELGQFLDAAASHRLGGLFHVMAFTGLRRGEALGLRWSDVDLTRGVVTVRQQLTEVDGVAAFGPPKTKAGEHRRVDLDQATIGALLEHQLHQGTEQDRAGEAWQPLGLVFCREDGSPIPPGYVTKLFTQLARKAKLRPVRLHDLRHGAASLQIAAGTPLAVVSKLMGHSTYTLTVDTYSHLVEGAGRAAAEAAAALVPRGARVPVCGLDVHTSCTHGSLADLGGEGAATETAGEKASEGAPAPGLEPGTLRLTAPPDPYRPLPDATG